MPGARLSAGKTLSIITAALVSAFTLVVMACDSGSQGLPDIDATVEAIKRDKISIDATVETLVQERLNVGSPAPTSTPTPTPAPTSTPTSVPVPEAKAAYFELAPCRFNIPNNANVVCGWLQVPEDRSSPSSPTISLHVAIFMSLSSSPAPDPVVYLEGGPGGHALETLEWSYEDGIVPFLSERNFVIFDQRGVGYSKPSLQCPELIKVWYETLDQDLSHEEIREADVSASVECRDRLLADGVDLKAYNSRESAADLADLRKALGYDHWNLYGSSYGTRLALTTMRDHPVGIRSVILDSSYPLQVDLDESFLHNMDRAFARLFEDCEADRYCSRAYPELESIFYDLMAKLDAAPVSIKATNPVTGEYLDMLLDGEEFGNILFQSLYATELIPMLPSLTFATQEGKYTLVERIAGFFIWSWESLSVGMYLSVQCGEEVPFSSPEKLTVASNAYPQLRKLFDNDYMFAICDSWQAREADPIENRAVSSGIPTLVLAGSYDPITPPSWGRATAETLSSSFFYEFPGIGHGVSTSGQCPLNITLGFLDNPSIEPDTACISKMSKPVFE